MRASYQVICRLSGIRPKIATCRGRLLKRLMTPVPPSSVLFVLQSGYSAARVMPIILESKRGCGRFIQQDRQHKCPSMGVDGAREQGRTPLNQRGDWGRRTSRRNAAVALLDPCVLIAQRRQWFLILSRITIVGPETMKPSLWGKSDRDPKEPRSMMHRTRLCGLLIFVSPSPLPAGPHRNWPMPSHQVVWRPAAA
jgi:hypothetical protein